MDSITYVVVQHCEKEGQPTGTGYVVRTATNGALGLPYATAPRAAEYRRQADAERKAAKLNATRNA